MQMNWASLESTEMKNGSQQNVCAIVGFGVSYKFLSSFNVWSRGANTFSKAHHCANTHVVRKPPIDMKDFGQINGRRIKYLSIADSDWETKLPTKNWLVIPFGHEKNFKLIENVAKICLDRKVNYVCTIGQACESIHDTFDEEVVERVYVKAQQIDQAIYGDGEPMTTWHNNSEEGIWFAINAAFADKADIDSIVIIDLTENGGLETIENIVSKMA